MANTNYDISVIIPIYNVENYLRPCLDSLMRQGDVSLQVIMIDDGSTDSSGRIADEYAAMNDSFICRHIENGGQGNARNIGVTLADGKYIVFLDSDDIVPDNSYYKMFRIAERDGSDITLCNMARFNSRKIYRSRLHEKVFAHLGSKAHITTDHSLLYDTCSPNKLIKRSFYLENGFMCPSGYYYEDIPFCIQMHLAAGSVSVLHEIGYLWREREGDNRSVTQKTAEVKSLRDRITAMEVTNGHLSKYSAGEDLLASWKYKNLSTDFMIFLNLCTTLSDDVLLEMIDLVMDYSSRHISSKDLAVLSPVLQKKYEAIAARDLDALRRLREFETSEEYSLMPLYPESGHLMAHLPEDLFGTQAYDFTDFIREKPLSAEITAINISDKGFTLDARFYRKRPAVMIEEQTVEICLYNEFTGQSILMETKDLGGSVRASLDADPAKILPATGDPFRLRYRCSSEFFTDTGFLRFHGIKSGIKFPALIREDCYVWMEESPLHYPSFFCLDNSLFLDQVTAKGKNLYIKLKTPKVPLKIASSDDVILSHLAGLFSPVSSFDTSTLIEGAEYQVYAMIPAERGNVVRDIPVITPNKEVSVMETETGVILVVTLRTGILRLTRHRLISQVTDVSLCDNGFLVSAVITEGSNSKESYGAFELVTTDEEGHVTSVLSSPAEPLPSGEITFETDPGVLACLDVDAAPSMYVAIRCSGSGDGVDIAPLYSTNKLSKRIKLGSNAMKLFRSYQGRIKLSGINDQ